MWRLGAGVLVVLVGCGSDPASVLDAAPVFPDGAPSVGPDLATCAVGVFFAECGGTGAPRLACTDQRCLWFTGGVVANGYVASDCASDQICCHDDWPFNNDQSTTLIGDLNAYGTLPWDRARAMNVAVVVDPTLPAGDGTFVCTGTNPFPGGQTPCSVGAKAQTFGVSVGATTAFALPIEDLSGWFPTIEIDTSGATPIARVCTYSYTDALEATCPRSEPICADAGGTLTLDKLPPASADDAGVTGRLDVTLGSLHLTASF